MSETILYHGWITYDDTADDCWSIHLQDEDIEEEGWKDHYVLAGKIAEDMDHYGEYLSVRYTVTEIRDTLGNALEKFIQYLSGVGEAEHVPRYSETTGYLWTDENLKVGGHDLLEEIRSYLGKYLNLEITYNWGKPDD